MSAPEKAAKEETREGELLVGKYRLERRLGAGGMGEVYRAQNELIGREVAIKLMRPEHARNDEIVTRFVREAQAANRVRHPNVVDVLDVGKDEHGVPFIVQELLKGKDLANVLDTTGPLPPSEALELLVPVIEAVAVAHSRGVVHRDIKPDNIFLNETDTGVVPKVLDFGISKIDTPDARRVTATGVSMGTPAYMSPEQIQGAGGVDARSDVWALGVLLHEVLSGSLPFKGDTYGALFVQICTASPIPLKTVAPHISDELARVVARCLRRDASERYASAAELARDLRNINEGRSIEPTRKLAAVSAPSSSPSLAIPIGAGADRHTNAPTLAAIPNATPRPVGSNATTRRNTPQVSDAVPPIESSAPPAPRSKSALVLAAVAVIVLGVTGAFFGLRNRSTGTNVSPQTPTASVATAAPSASSSANEPSAAPTAAIEPSATAAIEPSAAPTASAAPSAGASASAEPLASATSEPTPSATPSAAASARGNGSSRPRNSHDAPPTRGSAASSDNTVNSANSAGSARPPPSAAHTAAPTPTAAPSAGDRIRPLHGTDQYE